MIKRNSFSKLAYGHSGLPVYHIETIFDHGPVLIFERYNVRNGSNSNKIKETVKSTLWHVLPDSYCLSKFESHTASCQVLIGIIALLLFRIYKYAVCLNTVDSMMICYNYFHSKFHGICNFILGYTAAVNCYQKSGSIIEDAPDCILVKPVAVCKSRRNVMGQIIRKLSEKSFQNAYRSNTVCVIVSIYAYFSTLIYFR